MGFEEKEDLQKSRAQKRAEKQTKKTGEETKEEAKQEPGKSRIFNARNCVPEKCTTCGGALRIGGPIWSDRIHQSNFVNRLYQKSRDEACTLKTKGRIQGVLGGVIDEELLADYPLNYSLVNICSELKLVNPTKEQIIASFRSLNFLLCQTYYNSYLWKTNAPPFAIYEILKQFKHNTYAKDEVFRNVKEGSVAHTVLSKPIPEDMIANFDVEQVSAQIKNDKVKRKYFVKPEGVNWGPKSRATGGKV